MMKKKIKEYFSHNSKYYLAVCIMAIIFVITKSVKAAFMTMVAIAVIYGIIDIVVFIRSRK